MTEFEAMHEILTRAKYGSYLILPLKFDEECLHTDWLNVHCLPVALDTMDLNENVKAMMNENDSANVGRCLQIKASTIKELLLGNLPLESSISAYDDADYPFEILDSYLYIFHTQVAFLCLGITFGGISALQHILNPGYAVNTTGYYAVTPAGKRVSVDFNKNLEQICSYMGMEPFYRNSSSCFLEAYCYTLAVVEQRFKSLETIRQITYNLHALEPLEKAIEDESEQDLCYVYAKKDQELLSYRWGCCVTSQDISYLVADPGMNLKEEMHTQATDGLPVVALALYEKYTCLRFGELLIKVDKKQPKRIARLKTLMMEFQAYGTVYPANISRWHNVRNIYKNLLEVNEIPDAIEDIDHKLSILSEHQKELSDQRNNTIASIITAFGTVSIFASILSIVQILSEGATLEWATTGITGMLLAIICFVSAFMAKK